MPKLTHSEISRFSPAQLYALVEDVSSYAQFIPWCLAARIVKRRSEDQFLADLVIGFKGITEQYSSEVTLWPHDRIRAEAVAGPFHHLINDWHFTPLPDGTTKITLDLDFEFKGKLLNSLIGAVFERASHKMISAFRQRARELYGEPTS